VRERQKRQQPRRTTEGDATSESPAAYVIHTTMFVQRASLIDRSIDAMVYDSVTEASGYFADLLYHVLLILLILASRLLY